MSNQVAELNRRQQALQRAIDTEYTLRRNSSSTSQQRRDAERAKREAQAAFDAAYQKYDSDMTRGGSTPRPKSFWRITSR